MDKTIFVADDDQSVRQSLRLILEQAGYCLKGEAVDTESLLVQVCPSPAQIILLDWELPGLRVRRLLSVLRKFCPDTKVVALSVQPEARRAALTLGMDGFASKGDSSDQLLSLLDKLLAPIEDQAG